VTYAQWRSFILSTVAVVPGNRWRCSFQTLKVLHHRVVVSAVSVVVEGRSTSRNRALLPDYTLHLAECFLSRHLLLLESLRESCVRVVRDSKLGRSFAPATRTNLVITFLQSFKSFLFILCGLVIYNFVDSLAKLSVFLLNLIESVT